VLFIYKNCSTKNFSLFLSDFDEDVYLGLCLGDKRHPLKYLIPLTIVNCVMFATGIMGNVLGEEKNLTSNFFSRSPRERSPFFLHSIFSIGVSSFELGVFVSLT